jgi:hypothetical protein
MCFFLKAKLPPAPDKGHFRAHSEPISGPAEGKLSRAVRQVKKIWGSNIPPHQTLITNFFKNFVCDITTMCKNKGTGK